MGNLLYIRLLEWGKNQPYADSLPPDLLALLALPPASRNQKPRHRAAEEEKRGGLFGNGHCRHRYTKAIIEEGKVSG